MSFTEPSYESYDSVPPHAREIYRLALQHRPISDDMDGFKEAIALGVLVRDDSAKGTYRAVPPSRVVARLVSSATKEIANISRFLNVLPGIRDQLSEIYGDVHDDGASGVIEHIHGNAKINDRIEEILAVAETELITAQPGGPRNRETLKRSLGRDTSALERGVSMRTLYHATARRSPMTQEWSQVMAERGGEIRTLDSPFLRMIIVDRTYAFLQDCLPRDEETEPNNSWAHLIRDPAVCAFLLHMFERDWNRADYWHGAARDSSTTAHTTQMQRSILRLLASGRTQEQAARDLGLSTRTLQKHLVALRTRVPHLQSVPQMTYWWASCPDRHLD